MRHMKGTTLTEEEYEFLERVYLGLEQGCEYTQKRMLAIINKLEDKIAGLNASIDVLIAGQNELRGPVKDLCSMCGKATVLIHGRGYVCETPTCPICLGEKSVGQSDEGTLAACPNCQPAPEPSVQPWTLTQITEIKARAIEHASSTSCFRRGLADKEIVALATYVEQIIALAPAPAVRDAAVEELVRAAENAEIWLLSCISLGQPTDEYPLPMLRAALARVKGTKESTHD